MPRYTFQCEECYLVEEPDIPMELRNRKRACHRCDTPMTRRWSSPHVAPIAGIPNRIGREIEG